MKIHICILFFLGFTLWVSAVPANFEQQWIVMAGGDSLLVTQYGDEYISWLETDDGNIILPTDSNTFEYATELLTLSGRIARNRTLRSKTDSLFLSGLNKNAMYALLNEHRNQLILKKDSLADYINEEDSITMTTLTTDTTFYHTFRRCRNPLLGTSGNMKILTILIQFQDVKFTVGNKANFSNLMNQTGYSYNGNSGSVKDFYSENSYGQLSLTTTIVGPYTAKHNQSYYGENKQNIKDRRVEKLVYQAVYEAAKHINMAQFDNDGDGYVDCVHIVFAGHGEEESNKYKNSIWSHYGRITAMLRNSKWIKNYIITPELLGTKVSPIGVICHELGHALGVPDFYDINNVTSGDFLGTGLWDVMGSGNWNSNGKRPAHHNPYTKTQIFGWANTTELSGTNRLYTLPPSHSNRNAFYTIQTSTAGEYYILENRQQQKFDTALPGHGLVVWHIHAGIMDDRYAINTQHPQKCYPVYAAATEPIPSGTMDSYGKLSSPNTPFPGSSQNIFFTSTSTPRLQSWAGEVVQGKNICFIQENEGNVQFMLNPEIQGPSQFCDTAVYTLENVPAGATIEWKYSPNTMRSSALRIVRGQGSASATFRRGFIMNGNIVKPPKPIGGTVMKAGDGISKPFSGAATVMATVTMNNGTSYTVSKAVTLPPLAATETPIVTGWNNSLWYVDISHTLYVRNCDSVPDDRIAWEVHLPGRSEPISHVGRSVTFKPTTSGTVTVIVANTESCSASNRDTLTHTVRFKPIISYANPVRTAGTVEISVSVEEQTADFATVTVPYDGEYTLELWSELYGRVRTVEADAATVQIPLSGLNAGTYFLKLIINNEPITTQQLIIK